MIVPSASSLSTNALVSAREIIASQADGTTLRFIDVRGQDSYRIAHIPRSLNLPLFVVKTKGFLRSNQLVLLHEGHETATLLEECRKLRAMGFSSPRVLDGGVRAWQQVGGSLEGDDVKSGRLAEISPAQFELARSQEPWLIVSTDPDLKIATAGMGQPVAAVRADGPGFIKDMGAAIQRSPGVRRVLVATTQDERPIELEKHLRSYPELPVFYLSGGPQAYAALLERQTAMQHRQTNTLSSAPNPKPGGGRGVGGKSGGCCGGGR